LCAKSIRDHKALKVLLLTGWEGRLQEFLEDKYQECADHVDNGEKRIMDRYLDGELPERAVKVVEDEAATLASVIMGH
jgi:uncharacterized protein YqeY